MRDDELESRLTNMVTDWSLVFRAKGVGEEAVRARNDLLERYCRAVHRFLRGKLPNDEKVAGEIFSLFVDGVLQAEKSQGFLFSAGQKPGRFRHYVKRVLSNKIIDYYRLPRTLSLDGGEEDGHGLDLAGSSAVGPGQELLKAWENGDRKCWEDGVWSAAWKSLEQLETQTGQPFWSACRHHFSHPESRTPEKAAEVSKQLNRTITPENFRQLVHRGKEKLADLLLHEVVRSLRPFCDGPPDVDTVREEMAELNLLPFCDEALKEYENRQ